MEGLLKILFLMHRRSPAFAWCVILLGAAGLALEALRLFAET